MWLTTVYIGVMGLSIIVGGFVERKIGARWTAVVGSVIFTGATVVTYFTVKVGYLCVILTYAMLPAFGNGLAYGVLLMNNAKVTLVNTVALVKAFFKESV